MTRVWLLIVAGVLAGAPPAAVAQQDSGAARAVDSSSQEGWLGMGMSCGPCSYQSIPGRGGRWTFSTPPTVFSVDPGGPAGRAGLRAGDTLLSINGTPLTSERGGAAFGQVRPGQVVTLRYRRAGVAHDVRLTAMARPLGPERRAAQYAAQAALQAQAEALAQEREMRRQLQRARDQLRRQGEYLGRVTAAMERVREAQLPDSAYLESLRAYLDQIDSAAGSWRSAESLEARPPAPPARPAAPLAPAPALAPLPPAPLAARAWDRDAGPLRYSGSLGQVLIEARGPGAVTTTEAADSAVVITSRDLSVRITIARPAHPARPARPARPAPAPRAAPPPGE